jgi:hypothetical protein
MPKLRMANCCVAGLVAKDVWIKIDPYKEYAALEKPQKLTILQIGALCICSISFFIYSTLGSPLKFMRGLQHHPKTLSEL